MAKSDTDGKDLVAINAELSTLYRRGLAFEDWGKKTLTLALIAAIVAVALMWLAAYTTTTSIGKIDVPSVVIDHLSDSVTLAGNNKVADGQFMIFLRLVCSWLISDAGITISLIILVICGGCIIYFNDTETSILIFMAFAALVLAANLISGIDPATNSKTYSSDRESFLAAVRNKDLSHINQFIVNKPGLSYDYVRAQVALLQRDGESAENKQFFQGVASRLDKSPDFTPEEKVVYLIEMAAYGEPRSAISRSYLSSSTSLASVLRGSAHGGLVLSALFFVVGLAFLWFSRSLLNRLFRIDDQWVSKLKAEAVDRYLRDPGQGNPS
ncbi:hypothetical protein [Pseudomonas syringae]|uniref:hypothetical protein n=1 Tax=Pseudomonas syringae TaxID=317 RepID=UPI00200A13DC|nr:hypothetical protein [Pseudomonas syringae]MCK9709847.1 hypothetical protein [Pseudomonas syringae pv. syringae]